MTSNLLRRTGIASMALALSVGLAACGSDDEPSASNDTAAASSEETSMDEDPAAQTFGEGCSLIPADGAGSFNGMATAPVATAASANPLLKTLVTAVGEAGLGDTLNSAEALTVFAPTDNAFAKVDKATLDGLLADKEALTTVLTHHVVAGQLSPDEVAGTHETLAGDKITVKGSDDAFTVADENAKVLCGNIPTANATVYLIDSVLVP